MENKININLSGTPKVSIITVVYNGEQFVEQTIKSIINQTYDNIEYIIVDGDSTDKTKEIISKYELNIQKYISEKDKGIYDAMNKGLNLATGEYVWFINVGDEIYDTKIVENIFRNYENEDVYYGETQLIEEDGSFGSLFTVPKKLTFKKFAHGMAVSHQSIIIRREYVKEYNTDYKIVADLDWIISALKKSHKIKYTNLVMSKYMTGGFSAQSFLNNWKEAFDIVHKHYGFSTLLLNYIYFLKAAVRRVLEPYFSKKIIRNALVKRK